MSSRTRATPARAPVTEPAEAWIDRLQAALRPQFDADIIKVSPDDPVLGAPACLVAECQRMSTINRLCFGHNARWKSAGRPTIEEWAPGEPHYLFGSEPLRSCDVASCERGRSEAGLCDTHLQRWRRAGSPQVTGWVAAGGGPPLAPRAECLIDSCHLHREGPTGLCRSHHSRWKAHGRAAIEQFVAELANIGPDQFDIRSLPVLMRREITYGLQCRVDAHGTRTRPDQLSRLLAELARSGAESLFDRPRDEWLPSMRLPRHHVCRRFLLDTIDRLDELRSGTGWDIEYPRDVWRLNRVGFDCRDSALRFDGIEATWLRPLAKRWARWQLSVGVSVPTVAMHTRVLTMLTQHCPQMRRGPQALTRAQIERHLAALAIEFPHPKTRVQYVSALGTFLRTVHQRGWQPGLPVNAAIYREDYPRQGYALPRGLNENLVAQLQDPANLARFPDPRGRLLTEILMGTGLRVGDGTRIAVDCIVHDAAGAPYLRYTNHKMRREALVPIDTDLADAITAQARLVRATYPAGPFLFPRQTSNPDGRKPYTTATFAGQLRRWLKACDLRDASGAPAHVTPHQWRHTYATTLINNEVPQEVVRQLLDHSSFGMTSLYARLSQATIRAQWERAQKVNIHGHEVPTDPDGAIANAAWMKNNLARAKMALPNGYCTLPLQRTCEYANACLTCSMFVTTAEFLPGHQRQLEATSTLIAQAEQNGQHRLIQMNRTVETNLTAIITSLAEDCTINGTDCGTGCGSSADHDREDTHAE